MLAALNLAHELQQLRAMPARRQRRRVRSARRRGQPQARRDVCSRATPEPLPQAYADGWRCHRAWLLILVASSAVSDGVQHSPLSLNDDRGALAAGVQVRLSGSPMAATRSHLNPGFKVVSRIATAGTFLPPASARPAARVCERLPDIAVSKRLRRTPSRTAAAARIAVRGGRWPAACYSCPGCPQRAASPAIGRWMRHEIGLHAWQLRLPPGLVYCLPVLGADQRLRFAPWRLGDALATNRYGIPRTRRRRRPARCERAGAGGDAAGRLRPRLPSARHGAAGTIAASRSAGRRRRRRCWWAQA